jgi:alpha-galactosidase
MLGVIQKKQPYLIKKDYRHHLSELIIGTINNMKVRDMKTRIAIKSILVLILLSTSILFAQKFDGLALTPPMGWNSWNTFACSIDEALIRQTVDIIVANGMKDAGYQYVVIDDCWEAMERDKAGNLVADPNKFPSGMKALGDYIHLKGMKFGIHNCAGTKTCAGYPGGRGHEFQDALTYASWGVDFLKYDWCEHGTANSVETYKTMRDAIHATGRPIVFSICEWGDTKPWEWGKDIGHLWRITGDITNCFDCEINHGTWSSWGIIKTIELRKGIRQYAGPDHWNDPDMMEVGNGMTLNEDRLHFSIWAMLAAPLISGNDLRNMKKETLEILTNKDVIAVDQDSLGIQALKFNDNENGVEVWVKPLKNGDWAVCFLNKTEQKRKIDFDWSKNYIADDISKNTLNTKDVVFTIKDLWTKKNLGTTTKVLTAEIQPHDVLIVRLVRQ